MDPNIQQEVSPEEWAQLWASVHETLYNTHYEEFVLEALVERWERASTVCRIVITITAPGSAISGWALWSVPAFRYVWAFIAGIGAVFAVLEAVLSMNDRIKEQTILLTEFRGLRTDIETFKTEMSIKALPGLQDYKTEFLALRARYSKATSRLRNDLWYTQHVQSISQSRLDLVYPR
jgi:hypothetical protein